MIPSPRSDIRFWFRGELRSVTGVGAQKTVLRWLREDQAATGTKEGCGEGDCGACTVVVGSLDASATQGLRLRAVNSCLLFLPALDGLALFTVEDVAGAGGDLHPVQRALVDLHASQCGFCTPGFVMSLWADYEERTGPPSRSEITTTLSGNLCRCTGYRPLVDAARAAWDHEPVKLDREPVVLALMTASHSPLEYGPEGQRWYAPRSLDALATLASALPHARIIAGATDLALRVTKGLQNLGDLISTAAVEELKTIKNDKGALVIGAAVTLTDAFEALTARHPELAGFWDRFASTPVRNAGTLGGNIANGSPIGDSMPVLLALGASLVLRSRERTRILPLDSFYLGYQKTARELGEVLVAVRIPAANGVLLRAWKVSKRRDQDISAVCGAFALRWDDSHVITHAKLAFGGMAAIPARAHQAEAALLGRPFDEAALERVRGAIAAEFSPLTDGRATAGYRMTVAQNLLTRLQAEVAW